MARKKDKNIVGMTADELQRLLKDTRIELGKLQFQHANNALKNTGSLSHMRRRIARIMTALRVALTVQS